MLQIMNERADEYLALLDKLKACVSEESTAVAIVDQIGRDMRVQAINAGREFSNGDFEPANGYSNGDVPATEKQKAFLDRLGVSYDDNITKREASYLIDQRQTSKK